ncbi:hypothetical protein EXIGLDRAFT_752036, partial [Exidia glandulosa HHB12029]
MELPPTVEASLAHEVEAAMHALLSQSPGDSLAALDQATRTVYNSVQKTLQRHSRRRNDRAAVNKLTPELFIEVLSLNTCLDILRASQVCQHWRN